MANIGIIRCEKNEERCPLTSCLKSMKETTEGFSSYQNAELVGVFTCRCPGNSLVNMAKILKSKGADTLHFCTCTFAHREDGKWVAGGGYCDHVDALLQRLSKEADIPCAKGTAHLPEGYKVEVFKEK
ncbi:MAG: CGGC domain-containing protein [Candidatus Abyssobacteria bacterium SURF_17]|jgi:predicted metal-binding protein|uniref:CGGC domain-containing protein n=1 Tax=Candidatus Abyssobacteria bacterium SURF_17 TaxID=2093361 RepID=A0A419EX69_9BACT|nr:MAG: CGGC domain-containing protein [Candidatus Abyssubacteria bacterium SURF_17]